MVDTTANFKLILPVLDKIPWDEDINNNMHVLDALMGRFLAISNVQGVYQNALAVTVGQRFIDIADDTIHEVLVAHTTPSTGTFAANRTAIPANWTAIPSQFTASSIDILTNKSIDLTDNTLTGTLAELNTAITDENVPGLGSNNTFSGTNTHSGVNTFSSRQILSKGVDIVAADPLVIGTDGNFFDVTGPSNVTAINVAVGTFFTIQSDSILTITHNATTLDLPGEADYISAAGDILSCLNIDHVKKQISLLSISNITISNSEQPVSF